MVKKNLALFQSLQLRLIALILITLILLTGNKFVNANDIPGLENFLDYVEAIYNNLYNPMKSGSQRTISWDSYTSHPYAQEAIIMKLNSISTKKAIFTLAELNRYFDELITDTQIVQSALQKKDIDPARLPELLNAYQLALMNKAEMELLPRILIGLILAKRPLKEIKLTMQFMQTRHEEFLLPFVINPQGIIMERLVFFTRHRLKSNKELIEEVKAEITKYPFDETTLYNGACIMSIINELDEARNLLARCMLLDKDIYQIKKDPDLFNIRKDVEFMTNLESGKIHPVVKPDQNHGVNRVEIIYRWSGLGKQLKSNRILTWERDHFIESEQKIKIEARVITELIKELTNVIPSDNLMCHITHTDDYPEIYIKFFHKDKGPILLYSSSNAAGMLPYNCFIDGQLGVLISEKAAKVISFLLNWLSIERGSPIATSCFGGNEILCEPQTSNSDLENLFIKDAGIKKYSINEIREESLPYALSKLPNLNLKYHTKHKILGNTLYSPLQIDRYYMEGPGSYNIKRHELLFIKMSKNDFSTWFYNSPENFLKTVQEIESELIQLIGRAPSNIIISPLITGFNALGYPEMSDLFASVNILESANLNFDSLGNNLVPLVVEVKPTRNDFKHDFKQSLFNFEAYYIPSKYLLIIRRINLGDPKGDYERLIEHFLKWGGIQTDISSGIENILFSNGRITLYLTKDTDQDKIDKIVSYAASMGRKTKIIGQKNKRIEIAAKEGSLIMTKKRGELPKLINK